MTRERPSYPRRQYRKAFRGFIRRNVVPLGAIGTAFLCILVAETFLLHGYLLGLLQGAVAMLFVGMVLGAFVGVTGSINQIVGSWGEDNTREALRSARRWRLIQGWVDGIEIDGGDVDHVVLLRDGRIVAIDSKWHSVDLTMELLARDAQAATAAARRASLVLRSLKQRRDVVPLVVVWGGSASQLEQFPDDVAGVRVICGRDVRPWLRAQNATGTRESADAHVVLGALRTFKERVRPDLLRPAARP